MKIPIRKNWRSIANSVLSYNYKGGRPVAAVGVATLSGLDRGKPEEQALKIGLLKSLKRARYLPEPLGHYGLVKSNSSHFTVQSDPALRGPCRPPFRPGGTKLKTPARTDMSQLASTSRVISNTERNAAEAEIEAVQDAEEA